MEQMKSVLDSESQMHSSKIKMGGGEGGGRVNFQGLHAFRFVCLRMFLRVMLDVKGKLQRGL